VHLFIIYNQETIGELTFDNNEFKLKYYDNWIKNGFELSPYLSFETVNSDDIKNFLKNLLPEGENLDDISIFLQISKYNTFGLIEEIGKDIVGAINFYDKVPTIQTKQFIEISKEELIKKVKNINYENILVWNGKVRLSIAGVGKKLPVMIKNKKIGFAEGLYASTHILKFDKKELHLVENEYLSLKLAKKVGLDVNEAEILEMENEKILMVKRFDRFYDEKKDIVFKNHIIDGVQLLNMPPAYKYQKVFGENSVIEGVSIKKLSDTIDKYTKEPIKEKSKLLNWILFNLIIGNSDAHGKNISFYIDNGGISITPFYDILNTVMYKDIYDTKLSMSIGDNFNLDSLEYSDLIDLAFDLKIKDTFLINRFKKLLQKTKKILNSFEESNIDKSFKEKYKEDILKRINKLFNNLML
jgi:serine/threonine-protein kinase HipA